MVGFYCPSIEEEFAGDLLNELVLFLSDGAVINGVTILHLGSILDCFHFAGSIMYLLWCFVFELFEGLLDIIFHA